MRLPLQIIVAFAALGLSLALALPLPAARAAAEPAAPAGLFGSHETRSLRLTAFKKWTSMLRRTGEEESIPDSACAGGGEQGCLIADWRDLLDFLKDKPVDRQIAEINSRMNRAPYVTDIVNWGVQDYWATLRQFLRRDGDCEDYAIAKYISLKALGVDADMMRIVVVQDTNLDVPHAVLVVSVDGKRWVLDNQISYVVREKAVLHYRPLYSINEKAWWLHRM